MKETEFNALFKDATPEARASAAKALGIEGDQSAADGEANKGLEVYGDVDEAMKAIEAHVARGGEVILAQPDQLVADQSGALRTVSDALSGALEEVNKSLDVQANGVAASLDAIQFQGEVLTAQGVAMKSLDDRISALDDTLRTAMRMPLASKAVRAGSVQANPTNDPAPDNDAADVVPHGEARKSLEAAFGAAQASGDKSAIDRVGNMMCAFDGGYSLSRGDLATLGAKN